MKRTARSKNVSFGTELKFYDQKLVGAALTAPTDASGAEHNPSSILNLTTMAQGDGESNRDGRKALVKSVYVTGNISVAAQINQTAVDVGASIYIALVHDKQTNGAQLDSEKVFTNPGATAVTAANPLRNLKFSARFKILDRVEIQLPQGEPVYDGTNIEIGGFHVPFKLSWRGAMPIIYNNTTETVASITDNSIQIVAYCNSVTQVPAISYNSRTRFVG